MHIVITDCDHDDIEPETDVATSLGADLRLADCRSEDDVINACADADAIGVQYAPITERVLAALPRLRAVGRYGVGVDNVDLVAATAHNVAVCNVPDYSTEEVSDHAIALTLSLARGIARFDRRMRAGEHELVPVKPLSRLRGRVFGVVGLGAIGRATARKARGMGYEVLGTDAATPAGTSQDGIRTTTLAELLEQSQVVSLHVPLVASTHHLIDATALARMRSDALLINTCRGGVVDLDALIEALDAGRIRGAGLDVFEEEPLAHGHPLTRSEKVVLTPHAAWYSEESYIELKRRTIQNLVEVGMQRRPRNILNPEVLARPGIAEERA